MRHRVPRTLLGVLFAILGLNALAQVVDATFGSGSDPVALSTLQGLVGTAGLAAAWGAWQLTRWAPLAALAYGLITGAMLFALPALLDLDADERGGIWVGAIVLLLFGAWAAWYLRRLRGAANLSARVANHEDVTRA